MRKPSRLFTLGLPVQFFFCEGNIRLSLLRVIDRKRLVHLFCFVPVRAMISSAKSRMLISSGLPRFTWFRVFAQQQAIDAFHQIIHITEGTGLISIAKTVRSSPRNACPMNAGSARPSLRRIRGSVGIEDAGNAGIQSVVVVIRHGDGFHETLWLRHRRLWVRQVHITPVRFFLRMHHRIAIDF